MTTSESERERELTADEQRVLDALKHTPTRASELWDRLGMTGNQLHPILAELNRRGLAGVQYGAGWYRRPRKRTVAERIEWHEAEIAEHPQGHILRCELLALHGLQFVEDWNKSEGVANMANMVKRAQRMNQLKAELGWEDEEL